MLLLMLLMSLLLLLLLLLPPMPAEIVVGRLVRQVPADASDAADADDAADDGATDAMMLMLPRSAAIPHDGATTVPTCYGGRW